MPFDKCVKHNGKVYCWDKETGKIAEIITKEITVSECPEIVVLDLMRMLAGEKI